MEKKLTAGLVLMAVGGLLLIQNVHASSALAPPLSDSVTKVERVLTHNPAWGTSQITCDTPLRISYNSPTVRHGFAVKTKCTWLRDPNSDGNPDSNLCGGCGSGAVGVTTVMSKTGAYLFTNVLAFKSTGTFVCRLTPTKMNCNKQ